MHVFGSDRLRKEVLSKCIEKSEQLEGVESLGELSSELPVLGFGFGSGCSLQLTFRGPPNPAVMEFLHRGSKDVLAGSGTTTFWVPSLPRA